MTKTDKERQLASIGQDLRAANLRLESAYEWQSRIRELLEIADRDVIIQLRARDHIQKCGNELAALEV